MQSVPTVTVVIPAYNEARRLLPTLARIRDYAVSRQEPWELLVVDDGSTDDTVGIAQGFDSGSLRYNVLANEQNRGKGFSVRRGMLAATGQSVLMCDADLATPIEEIEKLAQSLGEGFEVAIASRDMPDSELRPPQPLKRRVMGAVFRWIRQRVLLSQLRDTQCGFKLFTRDAAQAIFSKQEEEGFAFDCEVLGIADRLGYRISEVGVLWCDDRESTVRPVRDSLRMLRAIFRIAERLKKLEIPANAASAVDSDL